MKQIINYSVADSPSKENQVFAWYRGRSDTGANALLQVLRPAAGCTADEVGGLKRYFSELMNKQPPGVRMPKELASDGEYPVVLAYPDDPDKQPKPLLEVLGAEPQEAKRLWCDASETLRRLHNSGLVHGCVTPECFIVMGGKVLLSNLGYGPLLERGNAAALKDCGAFAAPEVARRVVGPAADIYGFGQTVSLWRPDLGKTDWFRAATALDPANRFFDPDRQKNSIGQAYENLMPLLGTRHRLEITLDPPEGGTATGDGEYEEGTEAKPRATAHAGWKFDRWSGDTTPDRSNSIRVKMDRPRTLIAHFQRVMYMLTVSVEPPGAGTVLAKAQYPAGEEAAIEAKAASKKWRFDRWSGSATGPDNPVRVRMDADKTLTAHFEVVPVETPITPIYHLTVSIEPPGGGTVEGGGSYKCSPDHPCQADLRATASEGWQFDEWDGDLRGSSNPATVRMDANKTVTARFSRMPCELEGAAEPPESGKVTGLGRYAFGDVAKVSAVPANPSWAFRMWKGDLSGASNPAPVKLDKRKKRVVAQFVATKTAGVPESLIVWRQLLMGAGSPPTLLPLLVGVTVHWGLWACGSTSGLAAFLGTGCLLVSAGIFLTRLVLGWDAYREIAVSELKTKR